MRLAKPRVGAHGIDASADDNRRIKASCGQNGRNHRSRGGLAVHPGDGNAIFQAHEFGQHLGTLNHRNVQFVRLGDFRIVFGDCRTGDNDFGSGDIFGAVTLEHDCSETRETLRDRRTLQIGAGNLVAEIQQDLGNTAHADPADAYEVDALDFCEHEKNLVIS